MSVSARRRKRAKNGGVDQPVNVDALRWAQRQTAGTPVMRDVLEALAARCDRGTGRVHVSQFTIARDAQCSLSSVKRAIDFYSRDDIGLVLIVKRSAFKRRRGRSRAGRAEANTYLVLYREEAMSPMRPGETRRTTRDEPYATSGNGPHRGQNELSASRRAPTDAPDGAPPARRSTPRDDEKTTIGDLPDFEWETITKLLPRAHEYLATIPKLDRARFRENLAAYLAESAEDEPDEDLDDAVRIYSIGFHRSDEIDLALREIQDQVRPLPDATKQELRDSWPYPGLSLARRDGWDEKKLALISEMVSARRTQHEERVTDGT